MTVNGIWEWASGVSSKLPLTALRGKTLSIDGHIWMYESLKGCEAHHQIQRNSYLVTFFTRIQRLREWKVTPIVVFDGMNSMENTDEDVVLPRKRRFTGAEFTKFVEMVHKTSILLSKMGVRFIFAPSDGEAQCAKLELAELTAGCISTDFDYFLFGGRNLYRVEFGDPKDVMHTAMGRLCVDKKISRPHLISSAILLGCDYYRHGVQGCGIATVFDILAEFGDNNDGTIDPLVILDRFASYSRGEIPARSEDSQRKLALRRKSFKFATEFPNCDAIRCAIKMYLESTVNLPKLPIPIPVPNPKAVEDILMGQCDWSAGRMEKEVSTNLKRTRNATELATQTHIPEFFTTTKRFRAQIVTPCSSMDEYISANSKWKEKKTLEEPRLLEVWTPRMKAQEAARMRSERIRTPPEEEDDDSVIVLND